MENLTTGEPASPAGAEMLRFYGREGLIAEPAGKRIPWSDPLPRSGRVRAATVPRPV